MDIQALPADISGWTMAQKRGAAQDRKARISEIQGMRVDAVGDAELLEMKQYAEDAHRLAGTEPQGTSAARFEMQPHPGHRVSSASIPTRKIREGLRPRRRDRRRVREAAREGPRRRHAGRSERDLRRRRRCRDLVLRPPAAGHADRSCSSAR